MDIFPAFCGVFLLLATCVIFGSTLLLVFAGVYQIQLFCERKWSRFSSRP